jgi:hypothetical protein
MATISESVGQAAGNSIRLPTRSLLENLSLRGAPVAPAYRECDLIL